MLPKLQINKNNVKKCTKHLVYNVKLMTQKYKQIKVKKSFKYSFNCYIFNNISYPLCTTFRVAMCSSDPKRVNYAAVSAKETSIIKTISIHASVETFR